MKSKIYPRYESRGEVRDKIFFAKHTGVLEDMINKFYKEAGDIEILHKIVKIKAMDRYDELGNHSTEFAFLCQIAYRKIDKKRDNHG